jgi:hypothetical protein
MTIGLPQVEQVLGSHPPRVACEPLGMPSGSIRIVSRPNRWTGPVMAVQRSGKWCLGHGVIGQAESLRTGHFVTSRLVDANFSNRDGDARASKGFARTIEPRCDHCRSIRRWHDHHANAERRARRFRREHAERWVKQGRAETLEDVYTEMDIGGVTEEALTAKILEAIGEFCPGLCAYEEDGQIIRHTIDKVNELHIDVKNPLEPFTLENIGILCVSCNPSKGETPWVVWMFRRRAQWQAWQDAIDHPHYRGSEQPTLPGFELC